MIELPLPIRRYYERQYLTGKYALLDGEPATLEQVLQHIHDIGALNYIAELKWEINYNR